MVMTLLTHLVHIATPDFVITMSENALVPNVTGPSAGTLMTIKLDIFHS